MRLSTATKIAIARRIASFLFTLGFKPHRQVRRRGVNFALDLREGIDLSIFLFAGFQNDVLAAIRRHLAPGTIVIDVGANIGAMSLPIAAKSPEVKVVSVEPTDYAFGKLSANVALNPNLHGRISTVRTFVADHSEPRSTLVAYSSWRVDREAGDVHPVHRGTAMPAECGQITVDDLAATYLPVRTSVIKIDTDGHEYAVLSGAHRTLETARPAIVFEACEYLMMPPRHTFEDFERLFREHRYTICDLRSGRPIDAALFRRTCPSGGGLDLLALPDEITQAAEPGTSSR
jgi:FkbM family methyltransferase